MVSTRASVYSARRIRSTRAIWLDRIKSLVAHAIMVAFGIFLLAPFAWLVSTSLKFRGTELMYPPQWIPNPIVWDNYRVALTMVPFGRYVQNTLVISIVSTFGGVITASIVGYGFARLRFPGRGIMFALCLSTLMLPRDVTRIPEFIVFRQLGWLNSFYPLIVPYFFGGGAFAIFLMRQFYMTIPYELDEAARVDGANSFYIWSRLLLPLSGPVLATLAILQFIFHWNDFINPLIYLSDPALRTVSLGLRTFIGTDTLLWNYMMAASTVMIVPIMVLFFCAQRYFVRGIVMTGLAGR